MTQCSNPEPAQILLVEDNPADARIAVEAIQEGRICNKVAVVQSGEDAMSFLRQKGKYTEAERPDLILLDLNLPGKDGRRVLAEIKQDPRLSRIPVIVLTTSEAEQDILEAYDLHANCYIVKPLSYDLVLTMLQKIGEFWFEVVKLPPRI